MRPPRAPACCRRLPDPWTPTPRCRRSRTFGTFDSAFSEHSLQVREAADRAIRSIGERRRIERFLKLTETQGAYCAHPLGGCRMADSPDLGVVDDGGAAFGYEGL